MIISQRYTAFRQFGWLFFILELALVFCGVFIALQVDNWDRDQERRDGLVEMLERIEIELNLNEDIIAQSNALAAGGEPQRRAVFEILERCEAETDWRLPLNEVINDLLRDFSPALSSITLEQLNRRDPYLDLLSPAFRTALSAYTNQLLEEQRQLAFNASLRWSQHVWSHPLVTVGEGFAMLQVADSASLDMLCQDNDFRRQLFVSAGFVMSTTTRLKRFATYMETFRAALAQEQQQLLQGA
ncbi:MAG: hypothetical protein HRU51_05995 [Xanthomonadales bacterium]|nr:hypothetical protein [Xanthomonadales bacterium]